MLIGLNALKTISRRSAPALDSWFGDEEESPEVSTAKEMLSEVRMHKSLKSLQADQQSSVPSLPRAVQEVPKAETPAPEVNKAQAFDIAELRKPAPAIELDKSLSPFQRLNKILEPDSASSQHLKKEGLLDKFTAHDCYVDISMAPDGGFNAALRSTDGYRRTVVCRADGTSSQRITGPHGEEVVRFDSQGNPIRKKAV